MTIGLSTYAFFWQQLRPGREAADPAPTCSNRRRRRVRRCFQICDYAPLDDLSIDGLKAAAAHRRGPRGRARARHPRDQPGASAPLPRPRPRLLDVTLVRSMLNTATEPTRRGRGLELLRRPCPQYEEPGVTLALETYEQVPSADLVDLVEQVDSPAPRHLPRPGQLRRRLELPDDVDRPRAAPYVKNMARQGLRVHPAGRAGSASTSSVPARRGAARLRLHDRTAVGPTSASINQIIEHWLPWQGDARPPARSKTSGPTTTSTT